MTQRHIKIKQLRSLSRTLQRQNFPNTQKRLGVLLPPLPGSTLRSMDSELHTPLRSICSDQEDEKVDTEDDGLDKDEAEGGGFMNVFRTAVQRAYDSVGDPEKEGVNQVRLRKVIIICLLGAPSQICFLGAPPQSYHHLLTLCSPAKLLSHLTLQHNSQSLQEDITDILSKLGYSSEDRETQNILTAAANMTDKSNMQFQVRVSVFPGNPNTC